MQNEYGTMGKSQYEIWQMVTDRMMTATIFHSDASEMFDFMALKGYKRMHQFQSLDEDMTRQKLKKFYINNYDKLLKDLPVNIAEVIPSNWYNATRMDITPSMRKEYTMKIFKMYIDWESKSLKYYQECAKALLDMGHINDAEYLNKRLICGVRKELKCVKRKFLELAGMDFDAPEMFDMQQKMHDYYKCKIRKIGKNYAH